MMDATVNELAQLLISCAVLAGRGNLPTSGNVLDGALEECVAGGAFPDWFRQRLRFSKEPEGEGVRCVELRAIFAEAQASRLIERPNPTYVRTVVTATPFMAESMTFDLDVNVEDAREWGRRLNEAVERRIAAAGETNDSDAA